MTPAGDSESHDPELIELLRRLGATPEQLEQRLQSGHLSGFAGDLVLAQGADLTTADLAAALGVDEHKVTTVWRELGVQPDPGDRRFGERDVAMMRLLLAAADLEVQGSELMRVVGASLARVADAAVSLYIRDVEDRTGSEALSPFENAKELARTMEVVLRLGDSVLGPVLAQHLHDAIARQRATQTGVSERIVGRMAVGFVDLVGSTQMANRLSARDFLEMVATFEKRSFEIVSDLGGRIVKHVGDEVMFTAVDPNVACRVALGLAEEFTAHGIQPRGGVSYGEVITFHGDYYGPVVNLASRLTDHAVPGEILTDSNLKEAAKDEVVSFEPAGRRQLKGFDEPVPVFSLSGG